MLTCRVLLYRLSAHRGPLPVVLHRTCFYVHASHYGGHSAPLALWPTLWDSPEMTWAPSFRRSENDTFGTSATRGSGTVITRPGFS